MWAYIIVINEIHGILPLCTVSRATPPIDWRCGPRDYGMHTRTPLIIAAIMVEVCHVVTMYTLGYWIAS